MKVVSYTKMTVEKESFESVLEKIENKGIEFAYDYNDKNFIDENGAIRTITFSNDEIFECLMNKICRISVKINDIKSLLDSYENQKKFQKLCLEMNEYKKAIKNLISE